MRISYTVLVQCTITSHLFPIAQHKYVTPIFLTKMWV